VHQYQRCLHPANLHQIIGKNIQKILRRSLRSSDSISSGKHLQFYHLNPTARLIPSSEAKILKDSLPLPRRQAQHRPHTIARNQVHLQNDRNIGR
jgi:hypothetical protein